MEGGPDAAGEGIPLINHPFLPAQLLAHHFTRLEQEMRANGVLNRIGTFSGEGSGTKFTEWKKAMDRVKVALKADDDRMRFLTLQSLTGQAAEYASSLVREDANITWTSLKDHLRERYSDLADVLYARQRLRRLKQKRGETVQNYFQRIVSLAEESYTSEELTQDVLQGEMIEIFVYGLTDAGTAKRLLRYRPKNMAAALKLATTEQSANRTFELRRSHEEPMEVDAVHGGSQENAPGTGPGMSQMMNEVSGLFGHQCQAIDNQCHAIDMLVGQMESVILQIQEGTKTWSEGTQATSRYNGPKCFRCGVQGHFAVSCPSQQSGAPASSGQNRGGCSYCHRGNHRTEDCLQLKRNSGQKPTVICYFCMKPGHTQNVCRQKQAAQNGGTTQNARTAQVGMIEAAIAPLLQPATSNSQLRESQRAPSD